MSKKKCYNHGDLPKYYVNNHHQAIIDRNTFDKVQEELKVRAEKYPLLPQSQSIYSFTGKLVCTICGRHYRRRIANAGSKYAQPTWICSTFKQHGKTACPSKQIPETVLYMASAEVLELTEFDQGIFEETVKEIQVAESNKLIFVFCDGHTTEQFWRDRSRSESWTVDMRRTAREKAKGGQ